MKRLFALLLIAAPLFGQVSNPATNGFSVLGSSSIPVIVAPNGTIATSGVVTLGTALPHTYPYAWFWFPASAVSGGSAGVYYATCTSTTSCQVYTNYANPASAAFTPSVPTSPVAATGSNSAYTQTTGSDLTLLNVALAGGTMGPNGTLRKTTQFLQNNSAGAKLAKIGLSGGLLVSNSATTVTFQRVILEFHNMGDQAHQSVHPSFGSVGTTTGTFVVGTLNLANAQNVVVTCQIATATDYCGVLQNVDEVNYQP